MTDASLIHVPEYDLLVHRDTKEVFRVNAAGALSPVRFHLLNRHHYVWTSPDGRYAKRSRVIAMAFLPRPEGAKIVRHKDGNSMNDDPSNLEWVVRGPANAYPEANKAYRERNVFLCFADRRQYWCSRDAVAHLMNLKPSARGQFKPEYAPRPKEA